MAGCTNLWFSLPDSTATAHLVRNRSLEGRNNMQVESVKGSGAHSGTFSTAPTHQPLGSAHAERHQQEHRPQRPTERSDPTQHAKGRTGDCPGPRKGATTRRNVTHGGGDSAKRAHEDQGRPHHTRITHTHNVPALPPPPPHPIHRFRGPPSPPFPWSHLGAGLYIGTGCHLMCPSPGPWKAVVTSGSTPPPPLPCGVAMRQQSPPSWWCPLPLQGWPLLWYSPLLFLVFGGGLRVCVVCVCVGGCRMCLLLSPCTAERRLLALNMLCLV